MSPSLTPSRFAIIIACFSLVTFFWTYGLPHPGAEPALPVIDHYDHKNVHTDPIIPAPVIETTPATLHTPTQESNIAAKASQTHGVAEFEEDGGRWEDATKLMSRTMAPASTSATAAPTTLVTEATPVPKPTNAANATPVPAPSPDTDTQPTFEKFCRDVRGAPHVMVVLKTSHAEINKVSTHLHNLLSCVPNTAIFSDHAGEFEGHKVHNALDSISHETKIKHDEFKEYQLMQADPAHEPDPNKTKDLEKWKFLPMVYKAYHLNPSARFVVFIEADTSLSWTNLLQWVNRLDYRIPYYSGAPAYISSVQLAQRGPGIMLSQGALRRFAKSYDELYSTKWEKNVGEECCGDLMLAKALGDAHVEFYASWPLLQGERPSTLDYTKKHWCVPAVSWHHINGDQLARQWQIERNWTSTHGWDTPYLYRDAFHHSVQPHIEARKDNWDNLSQDTKIVAPKGRQQQLKDEANKKQEQKAEQAVHTEEEKKKIDTESHKAEIFQEAGTRPTKRGDKEKAKEAPNWDKLPEKVAEAGDSAEACQKACDAVSDCLQWRYASKGDGECHLSKVLRLGGPVGDGSWTSGWLMDRMQQVTKEWECKQVNWKFYQ
ncbi:glycosyltransferase family 31 [Pyrenophora seminiperda CCB06]|uniref:Glycosyltransferase family 31 n=1 Tax=Pyrenophora seminiperda CCB06 TaxID=1302712 RepID=A0A3M7M1W2_9PLEO|nr:glycosyltransferase family 31 [Pyrenophora seminiperda CCB06]